MTRRAVPGSILRGPRGIAMVLVLQFIGVVMVLAIAYMICSDTNATLLRNQQRAQQALYCAEAGAHRILREIYDRLGGGTVFSPTANAPLSVLNYYDPTSGSNRSPFTGNVTDTNNNVVGTFRVTTSVAAAPGTTNNLFVAYGNVPPYGSGSGGSPPPNPVPQYKVVTLTSTGTASGVNRTLQVTAQAGYQPAAAFQYALFCHNYLGLNATAQPSIIINGNVGVNGTLNITGQDNFPPQANGNPTLDLAGNVTSMAGVSTALSVVPNAGAFASTSYGATYAGGVYTYVRPDCPLIQMPTLNNPTFYAQSAPTWSTLSGGTLPSAIPSTPNTVYNGSLVLDGSSTMLTLYGTVVVSGDVIIKGTIKGQGMLYVGRNLYIAGNLTYPAGTHYSTRPIYSSSSTPQTWANAVLQPNGTWFVANKALPCIAFCVAKNIVFGDVSNSNWWTGGFSGSGSGISSLLSTTVGTGNEPYFTMQEDSGADRVWGSGDATENDGNWTVQVDTGSGMLQTQTLSSPYTPTHGNVVPGTGEDLDGNGAYTAAYTYNDFLFQDASGNPTSTVANPPYANWSAASYTAFAGANSNTTFPAHIDGFLYCNHIIGGYIGDDVDPILFHGGIAARAMLTVPYSQSSVTYEHDERIIGRAQFGQILPAVPLVTVTQWKE